MLWVDKHRPASLDKLDYHDRLSKQLRMLVSTGDFPHLVFYGPSGAGKKTRIMALLKELFGSGATKLRVEHKVFKPSGGSTTVEISTLASNHHIEMNPSDAGIHDRFVVQEVVKDIASTQVLDISGHKGYKVVVLNEVDKLTHGAQHGLRRTMEKYMRTCRIILCCQNPCKLIEPLRSRCLLLRVAAPSKDEVKSILQSVSTKEKFQLPEAFAEKVAEESDGNLRRALLMLESSKVNQYPFQPDQTVEHADWERFIAELAKEMCEEQSPQKLLAARSKLYELLSNCIPPDVIIRRLTQELLKKLDSTLKHEVSMWAAYYEHRLVRGSKVIFHLEAFVAKFMSIYKKWMMEMLG